MNFRATYNSPIGEITIITNETHVLFLGFTNQRYFDSAIKKLSDNGDLIDYPNIAAGMEKSISPLPTLNPLPTVENPVLLTETFHWLDVYFSGTQPDFMPPLAPKGTDFQKLIWDLLLKIPYGKTTTYGEIANEAAKTRGDGKMSNRAVGNAIGKNPISLIIPCHRVIGANGSLTGYAGGLDRKEFLLKLESGKQI